MHSDPLSVWIRESNKTQNCIESGSSSSTISHKSDFPSVFDPFSMICSESFCFADIWGTAAGVCSFFEDSFSSLWRPLLSIVPGRPRSWVNDFDLPASDSGSRAIFLGFCLLLGSNRFSPKCIRSQDQYAKRSPLTTGACMNFNSFEDRMSDAVAKVQEQDKKDGQNYFGAIDY